MSKSKMPEPRKVMTLSREEIEKRVLEAFKEDPWLAEHHFATYFYLCAGKETPAWAIAMGTTMGLIRFVNDIPFAALDHLTEDSAIMVIDCLTDDPEIAAEAKLSVRMPIRALPEHG